MSDKTSGQAAYEEHGRRFDSGFAEDWHRDLADSERAAWEAIAQAAIAASSMDVLKASPGDTVILATHERIGPREAHEIREVWKRIAPGLPVVIMDSAADVTVANTEPELDPVKGGPLPDWERDFLMREAQDELDDEDARIVNWADTGDDE